MWKRIEQTEFSPGEYLVWVGGPILACWARRSELDCIHWRSKNFAEEGFFFNDEEDGWFEVFPTHYFEGELKKTDSQPEGWFIAGGKAIRWFSEGELADQDDGEPSEEGYNSIRPPLGYDFYWREENVEGPYLAVPPLRNKDV